MTRIIVIMGTPGVGKSTIAGLLARRLGYAHFDVSRIVEKERLHIGLDEKRRTLIADPKRLGRRIREIIGQRGAEGFVVSTHYVGGFLPRSHVDVAFVLRLRPEDLSRRLLRRGWSKEKIWENVESELVGVCLSEAIEHFGKRRVVEIDTTMRSRNSVLLEMARIIGGKNRVKERAGLVDWLGSFEPEDWKTWQLRARSNTK